MAKTWWPRQSTPLRRESAARVAPGTLVILDRRAYRVLERHERAPVDWDQADHAAWVRAGRPAPAGWFARPLILLVRDEQDPGQDQHAALHAADFIWVLPEHFSVCRVCGELPPCRDVEVEEEFAHEQAKLARILELAPGCCHACGEPVTSRQKQVVFEGVNLIRPDLAPDTAIFHTRRACLAPARRYDQAWAAAEGGRRRKLHCPGHLTVHHGGARECTEAQECAGEVPHTSFECHEPEDGAECWCLPALPLLAASDPQLPAQPRP